MTFAAFRFRCDEEWNLHKHRIWLLSYLFSLSNSSFFFYFFFLRLVHCFLSPVFGDRLIAVNFPWLRFQCEITARQRQLCLCPLIHLPVYYCHMSQLANLQHMQQQQQQQQRATHGACCCNSSVRSTRDNICKTFAMILNYATHTQTHTHRHNLVIIFIQILHFPFQLPVFSWVFCFQRVLSALFIRKWHDMTDYSTEQRNDVQEASELSRNLWRRCHVGSPPVCLSVLKSVSNGTQTLVIVALLWYSFCLPFRLAAWNERKFF